MSAHIDKIRDALMVGGTVSRVEALQELEQLRQIVQDLFDTVRDHSAGPKFNVHHQAAYERAIAAGLKPSYP